MNKPADWIREAAIYQIFPDRFYNGNVSNDPSEVADWVTDQPTRGNFFGGDLEGIIQKLDYIQLLGINTIYLTPIFSAPSNHKYDTKDYYQVDEIFGGNPALESLTTEMHKRGMKLILDGVFNHCGDQFFAFQDVIEKGKKSSYSNWFTIHDYPLSKDPLNYTCCGDASYLPKLNQFNPAVKEYFLRIGKYWIEKFDIDGWRLDVPFKLPKSFWREFRDVVKEVKADAFLCGEVWRDGKPWVAGDIFDGVTNYLLRGLILDFCDTNFLDAEDYLYEVQALHESLGESAYGMVNLLGSHDTPRLLTIFKNDIDRTLLAWVLLLTEIGIPLIYYGDEVGMLGDNDPDCRRPMVWGIEEQNSRILHTIQLLLSLRKRSKALTHGTFESLFSFIGLVAFKRQYQDEEIVVVINTREDAHKLKVPVQSTRSSYYDVFNNEKVDISKGILNYDVFPAHQFRVYSSVQSHQGLTNLTNHLTST